jgi:hypothetical protein
LNGLMSTRHQSGERREPQAVMSLAASHPFETGFDRGAHIIPPTLAIFVIRAAETLRDKMAVERVARLKEPQKLVFGKRCRTSTGRSQKFVVREQAKHI